MRVNPFDREGTNRLNQARLAHLSSLDLGLYGKTVLEVGSGFGKLTHFFEEQGCRILSTEGRPDNVAVNLARHPWRKDRVVHIDLLIEGSHDHLGPFDIVFCYGTIYHLSNPAIVLADLARTCGDLLLLESRVSPVDNGLPNFKPEGDAINTSMDGTACRPARDWLMAEMRKHFPFVYITQTQPDDPEFVLEWPAPEPDARAVFVASRQGLDLPVLLPSLPGKQTKC